MHDDTWNITENISTSEIADAPSSLDHLNTFLESREVSPIRYTLRTSWNETSDRTKRQHVRKARQASQRFSVKWHQKIRVSYGMHSPNRKSCNGGFRQILRVVLDLQMRHAWMPWHLAIRMQTIGIHVDRYSPSWLTKPVLRRFKSGYQV